MPAAGGRSRRRGRGGDRRDADRGAAAGPRRRRADHGGGARGVPGRGDGAGGGGSRGAGGAATRARRAARRARDAGASTWTHGRRAAGLVAALGAGHAGRARGAARSRSVRTPRRCGPGLARDGARPRCAAAGADRRAAAVRGDVRVRMADRGDRAAVVRARAGARSAVRAAGSRRPRHGHAADDAAPGHPRALRAARSACRCRCAIRRCCAR